MTYSLLPPYCGCGVSGRAPGMLRIISRVSALSVVGLSPAVGGLSAGYVGFCASGLGLTAPSAACLLSGCVLGTAVLACREGEFCLETRASRSSVSRSLASSSCSCCSPVVTVCFLLLVSGVSRPLGRGPAHFSSTVLWRLSTAGGTVRPNMESKSAAKFCAMVLEGRSVNSRGRLRRSARGHTTLAGC